MGIPTFYLFFCQALKKAVYFQMGVRWQRFPEKLKKQPQTGIFTEQLTTLKERK